MPNTQRVLKCDKIHTNQKNIFFSVNVLKLETTLNMQPFEFNYFKPIFLDLILLHKIRLPIIISG